jgi:hypothetical protein
MVFDLALTYFYFWEAITQGTAPPWSVAGFDGMPPAGNHGDIEFVR